MRKSIIIEIVILILCALTAIVFATVLCDFTPSEDLSVKIFGIGTEMSPGLMVFIFWLFSIFTINSLRQITLKYKSTVTNLVLLLVALRLIYFTISNIATLMRLRHAIIIDLREATNVNNYLIVLWTTLVLLIITVIITSLYFLKTFKQRQISKESI